MDPSAVAPVGLGALADLMADPKGAQDSPEESVGLMAPLLTPERIVGLMPVRMPLDQDLMAAKENPEGMVGLISARKLDPTVPVPMAVRENKGESVGLMLLVRVGMLLDRTIAKDRPFGGICAKKTAGLQGFVPCKPAFFCKRVTAT